MAEVKAPNSGKDLLDFAAKCNPMLKNRTKCDEGTMFTAAEMESARPPSVPGGGKEERTTFRRRLIFPNPRYPLAVTCLERLLSLKGEAG
jgi:hypothetical protein